MQALIPLIRPSPLSQRILSPRQHLYGLFRCSFVSILVRHCTCILPGGVRRNQATSLLLINPIGSGPLYIWHEVLAARGVFPARARGWLRVTYMVLTTER